MNIKTERSAPVDSNALVPVALGGDHHISLIQHKHSDLFGVNELVLGAPVVDCARCTNDNLLLQLGSSLHWTQCRESRSEHRLVTRNLFFRREYKHYHILTSISPNGICQLHIWTKFPHLLNDLTSLQCELVRRCDAKALKENFFDLVNTFQGLINGYQLSQEIENAVILWGCSAYLSPLIVRVYMAEHGQRKCSSFTCARLRLCNQILRSESRKK